MKKIIFICSLFFLAIGFSSCEKDDTDTSQFGYIYYKGVKYNIKKIDTTYNGVSFDGVSASLNYRFRYIGPYNFPRENVEIPIADYSQGGTLLNLSFSDGQNGLLYKNWTNSDGKCKVTVYETYVQVVFHTTIYDTRGIARDNLEYGKINLYGVIKFPK
jgi:hypothetical protein